MPDWARQSLKDLLEEFQDVIVEDLPLNAVLGEAKLLKGLLEFHSSITNALEDETVKAAMATDRTPQNGVPRGEKVLSMGGVTREIWEHCLGEMPKNKMDMDPIRWKLTYDTMEKFFGRVVQVALYKDDLSQHHRKTQAARQQDNESAAAFSLRLVQMVRLAQLLHRCSEGCQDMDDASLPNLLVEGLRVARQVAALLDEASQWQEAHQLPDVADGTNGGESDPDLPAMMAE
eukprot:gene28916-35924_t